MDTVDECRRLILDLALYDDMHFMKEAKEKICLYLAGAVDWTWFF